VCSLKKSLAITAIVLLLAGLAIYQSVEKRYKATILPTEQAPKVDYLAPPFTLKGLDGLDYAVGGPRVKPLIINFWASWCEPCEKEAPDLVNLYNKYKGQFDLYAVNVTQGDKLDNVKKFVKDHGYPFPVLLDPKGEISESYRFLFIPTSFLVDKNGVIREVVNSLSPKDLEKKIKNLIAG
jgi:thiol-disulfide isomerase/thioredoxin